MGNTQAQVYLRVNQKSFETGETICFNYTSNLKQDFQPNTIFLELISPTGRKIHEKELILKESSYIPYRIPCMQSGRLIARVVDKTDKNQIRVLSELFINVKCAVIEPVPVTTGGVSLSLSVPPFFGYSQTIHFSREGGVQDNDYIEFHAKGDRVHWAWCKDKSFEKFTIDTVQDETINVQYYRNGSFFSGGTLLATMRYTLRNPVEELLISDHCLEIDSNATIHYKMFHIPPSCKIVVRFQGVSIYSFPLLPAALQGEYSIKCPRLPGQLEVACVTLETILASKSIRINDSLNRGTVQLSFRGYPKDHKMLCVRPNQRVQVESTGAILNTLDEIVIQKASIESTPTHMSIQSPHRQFSLGERGVTSFQLEAEGVYHINLGLMHNRVPLLGDWCTLIVSRRVGVSVHPVVPEPIDSKPLLAAARGPSALVVPTQGFICVICHDSTVSMKFDPCKHVCTCESCCRDLFKPGTKINCPMCRKEVVKTEKVFLS